MQVPLALPFDPSSAAPRSSISSSTKFRPMASASPVRRWLSASGRAACIAHYGPFPSALPLRWFRAEETVQVVSNLVLGCDDGDEVTSDGLSNGVVPVIVIGIGGGNDRRPELPLDGHHVVLASEPDGKDLARGGIDPVDVEVDELQVVFAREMPNGINVSHAPSSAD